MRVLLPNKARAARINSLASRIENGHHSLESVLVQEECRLLVW
jgi:hypothetical protein